MFLFTNYNIDLFKGIIKETRINDTIDLYLGTADLKANITMSYCQGWTDEETGYSGDDWVWVKVVKLYEDRLGEEGIVKRVWTDAYDEKTLLDFFPDIFNEFERNLLTYDWDEFSSTINTLIEENERRKEKIKEGELPF